MPTEDALVDRYWPRSLAAHSHVARRLLESYDGAGRSYHDARHLTEVLDRIALLLQHHPVDDVDTLLLAAWFHDAVYDPAGHNEERSANLAERVLAPTPLSTGQREEVARLVRLTATHAPGDDDTPGQVICDADLGILATETGRYDEYVRGVRQEYAHLSEKEFTRGRVAVLRALVDRPHLFSTRYAREHWEDRARDNVRAELQHLER